MLAPLLPLAAERLVNQTTAFDQADPAIAALENGGFVVVWESFAQVGPDYGVFGRRFGPDGSPRGAEFAIAATEGNQEDDPEVITVSGGFAVLWNQDETEGEYAFGRVFRADGSPATGAARLPATALGNQDDPEATVLQGGGTAVVWEADTAAGQSVALRLFDADYLPVSGDILIPTPGFDDSDSPSVDTLADGRIVVAFERGTRAADYDNEVAVAILSGDGAIEVAPFKANQSEGNAPEDIVVKALPDGGFVTIWSELSGGLGFALGVYGRRFDADGTPVGAEFRVNVTRESDQQEADVVVLADGGFVVLWESYGDQDGSGGGTYARRYDADGRPMGGEIPINSITAGSQDDVSAALLTNGSLAVAMEYDNGDGSGLGVFSRLFAVTEYGTGGADTLRGSGGADALDGRGGADRILARGGADTVEGGGGRDVVLGGGGGDDLSGNGGNDRLKGQAGADTLSGGAGKDTLQGGGGNDVAEGGGGADRLLGNAGNDVLSGGGGADTLVGGGGNDTLDGGPGNDMLTGGAGADHFVYGGGRDVIVDFRDDVDTLVIDNPIGGTSYNLRSLSLAANEQASRIVFDLGDGSRLIVNGISDFSDLSDDLSFV